MDPKGIILTTKDEGEEVTQEEINRIRDILKEQAAKLGGQLYERVDEMNTFKAQVAKLIEKEEQKKKNE
jgi:hypothetical protein